MNSSACLISALELLPGEEPQTDSPRSGCMPDGDFDIWYGLGLGLGTSFSLSGMFARES